MPELPEVELARRGLARWLAGATVEHVRVWDARVVKPSAKALTAIGGARIARVERRGKWLRVALANDERVLFAHLGMTGEWMQTKGDAPRERFERVRIDVRRNGRARSVRYLDMRMFGRVVVAKEDIASWTELGPDPLADGIDARALHEKLRARKKTIKEAMLDQRLLAGVGNILAIESLWRARVSPRARTNALTLAEVRAIARGLGATIRRTIAAQKGERAAYVNAGAPSPFLIYDLKGEPCPRCKTSIERAVIGGRSTYFCPTCQRAR
jgi:formamidopyrimidine-DNA glycosylase